MKETWVSVNDGPLRPYQGALTVSAENRVYKVAYKSIDNLGNEEQLKTATFHIMRAVPVIDLFVTNGQSAEEQVRTDYLDPAPGAPPAARNVASPTETSRSTRIQKDNRR